MFRRLACRTVGQVPGTGPALTTSTSAAMFTLPLLAIALLLAGLGIATANPLEVAIGAICLVAALSKPARHDS